jgi:regulator of replication initiation timing
LPTIQAGTIVRSNSGVLFELVEDLSFSEKYSDGKLIAKQEVLEKDINNNPISFILTREGLCISSQTYTENITINSFEKFKKITLSKENINQILSVVDNEGTEYYEVKYLTQDTVFKAIPNLNYDNKTVKNILQIIPAPYRFIKEMNIDTRLMTLTFGGGNANSLLDDIIPDPSDFALPLYGKTTFPKFDINPSKFLETNTLGLLKPNTTLTITYRYGGGLSHNIEARSTDSVETLKMNFPSSISQNIALQIRNSVDVQNLKKAIGGDDAPTVEKLKLLIPISKNNQNRIVTEQDALTAIYKLPANFGRVHRAAIRKNENNLFSSTIYLICKDNNNYLTIASDNLKRNVSLYLNEYRLISDSFDILDAQIINFQLFNYCQYFFNISYKIFFFSVFYFS